MEQVQTTDRLLLYTVAKRKPSPEVVAIGFTLVEARRDHRTSRRVYVTKNLLHVVGEFDVIEWPEVILCRFLCDEDPAPAREAYLCGPEMLEKIIENVDAGRAKVAKGELTATSVAEMERRVEAIIDAMDVLAGRKFK